MTTKKEEGMIMSSKKVTLKDVAGWANVSLGTVHRALNGKKGVSEPVRQKILSIAQESGYVPNQAAALLKQRRKRVLLLAPGPGMGNHYYYEHIWHGFRDYASHLGTMNFDVVEIPYYRIIGNRVEDELNSAYERYGGEIDGILASGFFDVNERRALLNAMQKDIPVVIAADYMPQSLANVYADFDITGRVAAELLSSQLPPETRVLICAGATDVVSQSEVVRGFTDYIDENSPSLGYVYLYGDGGGEQMSQLSIRLTDMLLDDSSLSAVFCVNARSSVVAAQVFRKLSLTGKRRLIGSDIFKENIEAMQSGVMQNILDKAPYQQAYSAAKILFNYLISGILPSVHDVITPSRLIFHSNLPLYIEQAQTL